MAGDGRMGCRRAVEEAFCWLPGTHHVDEQVEVRKVNSATFMRYTASLRGKK